MRKSQFGNLFVPSGAFSRLILLIVVFSASCMLAVADCQADKNCSNCNSCSFTVMCKCMEINGATCSCSTLNCCAKCCSSKLVSGTTQTTCAEATCGGPNCSGGGCSPLKTNSVQTANRLDVEAAKPGETRILLKGAFFKPEPAQVVSAQVVPDLSDISEIFSSVRKNGLNAIAVSGSYRDHLLEISDVTLRNESGRKISAFILAWSVDAVGGESLSVVTTWDSYGYSSQFYNSGADFKLSGPVAGIKSEKLLRAVSMVPVWVEYDGKDSVGEGPPAVMAAFKERRSRYSDSLNVLRQALSGKQGSGVSDILLRLQLQAAPENKDLFAIFQQAFKNDGFSGLQKLLEPSLIGR